MSAVARPAKAEAAARISADKKKKGAPPSKAWKVDDLDLTERELELLERAAAMARAYEALIRELRDEPEISRIHDRLSAVLVGPASLGFKFCEPKSHQKGGEHLYVHEVGAALGLRVCEHQHGADLVGDDGRRCELKSVTVDLEAEPAAQKACVNIQVPKGTSKDDKRAKLRAKMSAKVSGGGSFIIDVRDHLTRPLEQYEWPEGFALGLCDHLPIKKSTTNYNLTSVRCRDCGCFHRLNHVQWYAEAWAQDDGLTFTAVDWPEVFRTIPSHCGKKPSEPATTTKGKARLPATTA